MHENLLDKSKELVNKIYDSMNVIEQCNVMADKIKDLPVCFVGEDVIDLDKVISIDQMNSLRESIIVTIRNNSKEAEEYLVGLTGAKNKPAIVNPDFEEAVKEMVEIKPQVKVVEPKPKEEKPELTAEEVKKLQKNGYDLKALCEYFHCYKKTMQKFLEENGLVKVKNPLDYNQVKDMYVTKGMNLDDVADQLGYSKQEVYDFVQQNGIRRPPKKADGFRG